MPPNRDTISAAMLLDIVEYYGIKYLPFLFRKGRISRPVKCARLKSSSRILHVKEFLIFPLFHMEKWGVKWIGVANPIGGASPPTPELLFFF